MVNSEFTMEILTTPMTIVVRFKPGTMKRALTPVPRTEFERLCIFIYWQEHRLNDTQSCPILK